MPYAVTLRLDDGSAAVVVELWRRLAGRGIASAAANEAYAPHLTLGLFDEDASEGALTAAMAALPAQQVSAGMTLAAVGLFPGTDAVLHLAPVVTPALLDLHAALHGRLCGTGAHPHYRPGTWVPHVTLAQGLDDPAAALAALGSPPLPLHARAVAVELVRFPPVRVLARRPLPG